MEFIQELSLELNSNTAYTTIGAKQGDNNSRVVKVHVTENGADYNLITHGVSSVYFRLRKPDGKAVINTATISEDGTYVSIVLTSQALAAAGRGYADITLMQGSQILSTISFILLIMASPQIAEQATSSNEFGYLNAVVEDATHTIYEAEAWAAGTRGGQEVYNQNDFQYTYTSSVINYLSVDEAEFLRHVTSTPGLKRIFTFSYTADGNWSMVLTTQEGNTITTNNAEIIGNINDYGIIIGLYGGAEAPNSGDIITVTVEEADKTFQNNAKYYAEQARNSQQSIEDLSVSAESVPDLAHGGQAQVIKTIVDDVVNFHFKIPKGDVGDVYFMTFDIDADPTSPSYGSLLMYKPDHMSPQVDFEIIASGANEGCLGIRVNMGGN